MKGMAKARRSMQYEYIKEIMSLCYSASQFHENVIKKVDSWTISDHVRKTRRWQESHPMETGNPTHSQYKLHESNQQTKLE